MTFNILIATTGRESLQTMLDSLLYQLTENDCLTIVYDGLSIIPKFNLSQSVCKINQFCEPEKLGYWGHGIRNKYAKLLEKRNFIMHADDDDIYLPDTFNKLRELCVNPETLYIGKVIYNNTNIPLDNKIIRGNISTQNGIIPYDLNSKSEWELVYGGDGIYYENLSKISNNIIFLDIVIYKLINILNEKENKNENTNEQSYTINMSLLHRMKRKLR
jgi:hypothetical protein